MAKTFPNQKERKSGSHMNDRFAQSDATAARRVLRDCHIAMKLHASAAGVGEKRVAWIAAVTLLRTVGHVLDKVDGARSTFLRAAVDERWSKIRQGGVENQIFHDFIVRERNSILKEYRIGDALVEPFKADTGDTNDTDNNDNMLVGSRLILTKKVLREAINWWESFLYSVEECAHHQLVASRVNKKTRNVFSSSRTQ